jgi:fumarylacetoacetase
LYWTVAQIVTHHASNGCNLQPGDLIGTGTISTSAPGGYGSLLEISQGGETPITLPNGETRAFLDDGDEVTLRAVGKAEGYVPIGFGECRAVIVPSS